MAKRVRSPAASRSTAGSQTPDPGHTKARQPPQRATTGTRAPARGDDPRGAAVPPGDPGCDRACSDTNPAHPARGLDGHPDRLRSPQRLDSPDSGAHAHRNAHAPSCADYEADHEAQARPLAGGQRDVVLPAGYERLHFGLLIERNVRGGGERVAERPRLWLAGPEGHGLRERPVGHRHAHRHLRLLWCACGRFIQCSVPSARTALVWRHPSSDTVVDKSPSQTQRVVHGRSYSTRSQSLARCAGRVAVGGV